MFTNKQILASVILTIVSLIIGYYLNVLANRRSNEMFLNTLREELDIIDGHYERLLTQSNNIDDATVKYLKARRDYLQNKFKAVQQLYQ